MSKKLLCNLIGCLLLLLSSKAGGITRGDVIACAQGYSGYSWTVVRTNPRYAIYESSGSIIVGEAYSYGDKASTSIFGSEILGNLIPRNWEENFNTATQAIYTGIDCSGLVTRS